MAPHRAPGRQRPATLCQMRTQRILSVAALGLLALTACSASGSPTADSKYTQTWTTPYNATTCGDYLTAMTSKQRWVMAADVIASFRSADGSDTVPADSVVSRFDADIATACEPEATVKVTEAAVVLYKMDSAYQP